MRSLNAIKEMLCDELDEFARQGQLSAGSMDAVHKLTDTLKNIYKIEMLDNADKYSMRSNNSRGGSSRGSYENNSSRRHYVRGHYSNMGSRKSEELVSMMERALDSAESQEEKEAIQKCIEEIEMS